LPLFGEHSARLLAILSKVCATISVTPEIVLHIMIKVYLFQIMMKNIKITPYNTSPDSWHSLASITLLICFRVDKRIGESNRGFNERQESRLQSSKKLLRFSRK